jgi:hypothetical protein
MNNQQIIEQHKLDKKTSVDFKERRFAQWNENYYLYRDKIITNRLVQRQPINIPIVRDTIQNWISKIDEPPMLKFESRDKGNKSEDSEILLNEIWDTVYDNEKLDLKDKMEKKIVGLQGRTFKMWGWKDGKIYCTIIDPYDIELDPLCDPLDLNSAMYVIRTNVFRPLREILAEEKYDAGEKEILKTYIDSKIGIIKAQETRDEWTKKIERLKTLGATNYDQFLSTDVLVELNYSFRMVWDSKNNQYVRNLRIIANDCAVLYDKPITEAIGIDELNIVSWAEDPDLNDPWCDGKADSVRTINKVVNTYISQDLENRTYRNFGMYFYDTKNGTFKPRAFDPKPFGMFGVPGEPEKIIKQMQISPLGDTAQQINFLKDLIQSSVAQTPTERGVAKGGNTTLGEIELNLQQSTGRNESGAQNYRRAWEDSGRIFYKILQANSNGQITLYKKSGNGQYYEKKVELSSVINNKGYECNVVLKAEKESRDNLDLQKINFVKTSFPQNPVAQKLAKKKTLELLDWTPEEIKQVMEFEEKPIPTMIDPNNPQKIVDPALESATLEQVK